MKALSQISSLKEASSFVSWLFQIARNHYLDGKRRASSKEVVLADETPIDQHVSLQTHTPPTGHSELEVRQALMRLEEDERAVLILIDLEEYSYEEAAEIIGISENALRSRVHRARKAFLKIFNQE